MKTSKNRKIVTVCANILEKLVKRISEHFPVRSFDVWLDIVEDGNALDEFHEFLSNVLHGFCDSLPLVQWSASKKYIEDRKNRSQ